MNIQALRNAFHVQRHDAIKRRNIDFLLTFEEWLTIWIDSGHLSDRGNRRGKYVMARFGDCGPYKIGNVKIVLFEENSRENGINLGRLGNTPFFKKSVQLSGSKAALKNHLKGTDCPWSQLTKKEIKEIRKLLCKCRHGEQRKIAERFRVSPSTISLIKHNRIYSFE